MVIHHFESLPLFIHSWGGLGSQLYTINVALKVHKQFPKRKVTIVFHTSGVTRRVLEIPRERIPFEVKVIDDFVSVASQPGNIGFLSNQLVKSFFKRLVEKFGLVSSLDEDAAIKNLRWYCLQIRGHYSKLSLRACEVKKIWEILYGDRRIELLGNSCHVHLRLGDLLTIKEKSPIDSSRLISALTQANRIQSTDEVHFFSDSNTKEVRQYLGQVKVPAKVIIEPPWTTDDVIFLCTMSGIFVGTNSKVSLWTMHFRRQINPTSTTFLPKEFDKIVEFSDNLHCY